MPNKKKIGKKMKGGYRGSASDGIIDGPATPVATDAASRKAWNKRRRRPGNIGTPTIDNYNKWVQEGLSINQITERESERRGNIGRNRRTGMKQKASEKPAIPVAKATPIAKSKQGGSSYTKFDDDIYISMVMAVGFMGVIWFMISRTMIKHKYSEVLSYSLMGIGVILSLFLIIFKGVRQIKPSSSIIGAIKNMLFLRESTTGKVIAKPNKKILTLNEELHDND